MFGRRSHSLGENALRTQLTAAQQRITSLEGYINSREREYQATVTRLHGDRRESYGTSSTSNESSPVGGQFLSQRRRRMGRTTHGLTLGSMRSIGSIDEDYESNNDDLSIPLGEFVSLKVVKVIPKDDTTPIPFVVRRFIGRVYHIGPHGAVIGTSPNCTIVLPAESEVEREHCQIAWKEDNTAQSDGHFVLKDLMGVVNINNSIHDPSINEISLSVGLRFMTGNVLWELSALPKDVVLTAKLFHLANQRNLPRLKKEMERIEPSSPIPTLTVTGTEDSLHDTPFNLTTPIITTPMTSYDINQEYEEPSYEGDEKFNSLFSSKRSLTSSLRSFPPETPHSSSVNNIRHKPCLLLHIAIDNEDEDMVRYLLSRGANVNKSAGDLKYTAVHYAALRNNESIMTLLLQYGADLEIRNIEHLPPLALTTSYSIRKLILSSILLCAAADAGDVEEVTRLLTSTPISPNVLGLRHKNALHLSAAKGFVEIVQILLFNGIDVNLKGGSRSRTALHYASQNGHSSVLQLLLSAGAQEFVRDAGGYTALNLCQGGACRLLHSKPISLCIAVQSGDVHQVTQLLLEEQQTEDVINLRNDHNHAPLHLACITGSMELVQLLVSHGALVDIHGGSDSWTPLFYAAIAGHNHLVEFLLSVGADPEEQDQSGNTVREKVMKLIEETEELMSRLKKRNRSDSVVEINLIPRTSVNMLRQDSSPSCSVENQLEWQNVKLMKLRTVLSLLTTPSEKLLAALNDKNLSEFVSLLETGVVSPNVCIENGTIPILVQVCEDGLYGFAKALLDYGANVCLNGPTSHIPLLVAAGNSNVSLLKLLIQYKADINVQSTDTMSSALHEAAAVNSIDTIQYLLSVGANKELINRGGEVPFDCTNDPEIRKLLASGNNRLLVAAMIGDIDSINHLIKEEKLSVNIEFFNNGYTALHQACEDGHDHLIDLLIELGADCNKKGGVFCQTPLHISSQLNHLSITQTLLKHGAKVDIKNGDGKVPFEVATTNQMRKVLVEARQLPSSFNDSTAVPRGREGGREGGRNSSQVCVICMDNPINTIILPCGHQMFCTDCVTQITQCALDRQPIREVIPIYK